MARQNIGVGDNYNRGSGDRLRDAFIKVNANENELYTVLGGSSLTASANLVLAGPSAAGVSAPSFRSLVNADFPDQAGAGFSAGVYTAGVVQQTVNSKGLITVINRDGPAIGGVTSVGFSANPIFAVSGAPVTVSSTIALGFTTQSANLVLAGPATGAASTPAFRALVNADLQSQAALSTGVYTAGVVQMTVSNQGLITVVNRDGPATGGVTSVGFTAPGIFTVSGAPITAGSTIELVLSTQLANTIFAGPLSGGASAPRFRGATAPDLPNWRYNGQTSGYGLVSADRFAVVDYTGTADGSWSAIDAATVGIGHLFTVHNSSASGQLVVDGHSTQLIDGFTAITVLPKQSVNLMTSDASTWRIVGGGSYLIRQTVAIQAEGWLSRTAQGATDGSVELGSSIVVRTKDFDPGTQWHIQKDFTLPDSFHPDGPLTARYKASIASGSGLGVMGIQAIAYGSNSALNVAFGAAITQGLTFVSGNQLTNSGAASAPFVPAGAVAAGQTLKLQVFREAGTASESLATNLRLHEVIIEFDAIRFGSDA